MKSLKEKIKNKQFKVVVIGAGYVGLPLACEFAFAKFKTVCLDVDREKVDKINKGRSYIKDVLSADLKRVVENKMLKGSTNFSFIKKADAVVICVPTPLSKTRDPDISYIIDAVEQITKNIKAGQIIVLESTTYPGTTEEVVLPMLESSKLKVGKDFYLAFSPERVDPGNETYQTKNIPKIMGGITKQCTEMAKSLYQEIIDIVIPVSNARTAEMVKIWENTFRAVNIGLANEMAMICDKMGVDVWEVIEGAKTKPFGFLPFYPGPGLGGHCLPVDPLYLSWKAKLLDTNIRFIDLADEINNEMPSYVVAKVNDVLNEHKKCINKARILIMGVAYKRDIEDVRESPAFTIIERLMDKGAIVSFYDPYVPKLKLKNGKELKTVLLTQLAKYDCCLIVTDHTCFDFKKIVKESKLVLDTRNATKGMKSKKIVKL